MHRINVRNRPFPSAPQSGRAIATFAIAIAAIVAPPPPQARADCTPSASLTTPPVLTAQYDILRDAHNSNEAWINYSNISLINPSEGASCLTQTGFLPVDQTDVPIEPSTNNPWLSNPIYAQPLYVPIIAVQSPAVTANCQTIERDTCNMVVAVTLNGTIFAWSADNLEPIWNRQGLPYDTSVEYDSHSNLVTVGYAPWWNDCGGTMELPSSVVNVSHSNGTPPLPFIGTVSTPVIDQSALAGHPVMFVSSYCVNPTSTNFTYPTWFLHEIDLSNGQDIGVPYQINDSVNQPPTTSALSVPCTAGSPAIGDCVSGTMNFNGQYQNQRPALLEVTDSNVSDYPLIEVAFGALVDNIENGSTSVQFHGWFAQFLTQPGTCATSSCGLTPSPSSPNFIHNTSTAGPTSGSPACATSKGHYWTVSGSNVVQATGSGALLPDTANDCGKAGTMWSSTRGPAAIQGSGADIFLTSANGPFQTSPSSTSGQNTGQSILHFKTSQTGAGVVPYEMFTPQGQLQWQAGAPISPNNVQNCGPIVPYISATASGHNTPATYIPCTPALQPPQVDSACEYTSNVWTYCTSSVQVASNADWDMGTAGVILFQDNSENWYAVSTDKAGYGFMLQPGAFGGFQQYDYSSSLGGNIFPFAAANNLGPNLPTYQPAGQTTLTPDPDRITSMAFYSLCDDCDVNTNLLYFWAREPGTANIDGGARKEYLTALQLTTWTAQTLSGSSFSHCQNGATSGVDQCGSGSDGQWTFTGSGSNFTTQVLPGDAIIACGCGVQSLGTAVSTSNCPFVTAVASDTSLTLSKGFTEYASSATADCDLSSATVQYGGLFTNPSYDSTPPPKDTGYPGGVVSIASSSANSKDGLVVTVITDKYNYVGALSSDSARTEGNIYIYKAEPTSDNHLNAVWTTDSTNTSNPGQCGTTGDPCQTFCASSFALPTVVAGQIFLPTYAVLPVSEQPTTDGGSPEKTVPCPTDVDDGYSGGYSSGVLVYGFSN